MPQPSQPSQGLKGPGCMPHSFTKVMEHSDHHTSPMFSRQNHDPWFAPFRFKGPTYYFPATVLRVETLLIDIPQLHQLRILQEEWNTTSIKTSFDWLALDCADVADGDSVECLALSSGTGWGVSFSLSKVSKTPLTTSKKRQPGSQLHLVFIRVPTIFVAAVKVSW
ncbi:hypothetical protein BS17DRAFT_764564 [Gyrodon lividus]|nr:hypothetical protein BS17DRAFT_764564 [Gyrodon lividus]